MIDPFDREVLIAEFGLLFFIYFLVVAINVLVAAIKNYGSGNKKSGVSIETNQI